MFLPMAALGSLLVVGSSDASAQAVEFFAVLAGGNEEPAGAGSPNGYGIASVLFVGNDRVCFSVLVNGIDRATELHIHEGVAGKEGMVRVVFAPLPAAGNPGTSSGCVSADQGVLSRIRNKPTAFYINVHTERFPEGAIRGQLF